MKTKRIAILAAAVLGAGMGVVATELPGRDDLATAVGKTASVAEVLVKEARAASRVDGPNTLEVLAEVREAVAGEKLAGEVRARYEEARAALPEKPGLNVAYANRTGSGQELRTVAADRVLLLLTARAKEGDPFTIVRIEPVEKKKEIQELFAKKAGKPQEPPAGDPPRGEKGPAGKVDTPSGGR